MQATLAASQRCREIVDLVILVTSFANCRNFFHLEMLTHQVSKLWHLILVIADQSVMVKGGPHPAPSLLLLQDSISVGGACC